MSQIWIIYSVLILIGFLFFLIPFVHAKRKSNTLRIGQNQSLLNENVRLFHEQLADIELQKNNSRINEDEFTSLKVELERNLLQACQSLTMENKPGSGNKITGIYILVFLLFAGLAFALYQHLGASDDIDIVQMYTQKQEADYQAMLNGTSSDSSQSQALMIKLENRLQEQPENLHYWFLLARLASEQNDYTKAVTAYEQVLKYDQTSGLVKAELAQAMFLRDKHKMTEQIGQLAKQALEQEPNNTTALGLIGIYEFSKKDYLLAIKTWQKAVDLLGANTESGRGLTQGIEKARQLYLAEGGKPESLDQLSPAKKIILNVSLGAAVAAKPDQLVYVYARSWQGPKMPLAINRVQVSQLPLVVTLDESMAMSPQFTLASASQIEVVARISEDGSATAKAGDWQVSQGPFDVNKLPESIDLVIEKQME